MKRQEPVLHIYCEGEIDQLFIAHFIEIYYAVKKQDSRDKNRFIYLLENSKHIILERINGCDNLRSNTKHTNDMKENTEVGGVNIVIYDADFPENSPSEKQGTGNNGIAACRDKLDAIKRERQVEFDYHIWPDNENDGELENLLIQLIPQGYQFLFQCFKDYNDCLSQSGLEVKTKDLKEKLNTYCYATNHAKKATERDYKKEEFWNLTIEDNQHLSTFKSFLDKHLK